MKTRIALLTASAALLGLATQAFALDTYSLSLATNATSVNGAALQAVSNDSSDAAQAAIVKLGDRAMSAIADTSLSEEKKKQLFKQILSQNFDMTTIGKFAMGRYWRQATPAEQAEYLRLYEKMVIDVYTSRFNNYSGQKFTVTGNRADESGDIVVSSKVTGSGSPVSVDWRVRTKGGQQKIIDVMVEGVSMAVTQRNDFAGVIAQGGGTVNALISYLKKGGKSDAGD